MNFARARASFPLFLVFLLLLSPSLVYSNPDELVVSSNKLSYRLGATINVSGSLTTLEGAPISDGLVAVQVDDPFGGQSIIRVMSIGTPPSPKMVRIVNFTACDAIGNPKGSFSRGASAFYKITVENFDAIERQVTVTVNLFDSIGVSIAIDSISYPVPLGRQVTFGPSSLPIPNDAYPGEAKCYANALTNWPKDGGQPYCQEAGVNVTITDGTSPPPGSTPLPQTTPGAFSLPFKLPSSAMLGKYNVYASARYNAWDDTAFTYMWLLTDINTDGEVNIVDITVAATVFGVAVGDPRYYAPADINGDGEINILDITAVALDFGKSRL